MTYKVSELNPKDITLDKIHRIQKEIHKKTKKMDLKEFLNFFNSVSAGLNLKFGKNPRESERELDRGK